MKNIKYVFFLLVFQSIFSQNTETDWNTAYKWSITEKVYLHFNNVLYFPGETIHFKAYITKSDNRPTTLSDYLYVDFLDASDKKINSQTYVVKDGNAVGSYAIPQDGASGIYKIRAYTRIQDKVAENIFEKTVFVQKVISPRILMTLDFKKKAYGKGEICQADFELKNLENQPIKNYDFKYDIFIGGAKMDSLHAKTDDLGKAVIQFKLPENLKSNDGILNVMLDYDNFKESVTRSIPINLNFVDLQFLAESGNLVLSEASSLFFIAKNEFGLPMDVAGFIEDEEGNKVTDFKSFHDGMGNVALKSEENKKYFAVVTSPFKSEEKIALPVAEKNLFVLNAEKSQEDVLLKIYSPTDASGKLLVRNTAKIYKTLALNLVQGWNTISINTKEFPMGIQSFSLLIQDKIVAERLVFVNYQDGLKIQIKTDKENYLPREKVKVSIITTDKNNAPIASNLSVSVADSKLLTYIDDKQDNIVSWLLLGFELKGKIHEPRFYFDENKPLQEREKAIDLLLNTHGWRKYDQKELQKLLSEAANIQPEKSNTIEGFVLTKKGKPASVKVMFFTEQGKVFETKSNKSGYFKFNRIHFSDFGYLVAEHKYYRDLTIKNSFSDEYEFWKLRSRLTDTSTPNIHYKYTEEKEKTTRNVQLSGSSIILDANSNALQEVVTIGYGMTTRKALTGSIVKISSQEIFSNALSGRAAGIQISSSSGQVASADKVVIRGLSSIYGNRSGGQPLIVVDGIPYANNENSSVFGSLPVNSIESITILKDASATAVYGSAGAYGVIYVTTKNKANPANIVLGKTHNYTFQEIKRSKIKDLNEAETFYAPIYKSVITEEKTDFRNCIYWNSIIQTDNQGEAHFEFHNSDDNTSFKILAEGISYKGDVGKAEAVYAVKDLIQTDVKVPLYASRGDKIVLPLWLKNNSDKMLKLDCQANFNKQNLILKDSLIHLKPNESRTVYITVKTDKIGKQLPLEILLNAENFKSKIKKSIDIFSRDFPMNIDISGTRSQTKDFTVAEVIPGSIDSGFKLFLNPFSSIFDGLESMMSEPHGCFEQVSSTNYPNIMAMQLLKFKNTTPQFKEKALKYLEIGYTKLKNYESKEGGFEWYGGNPGNEALTAYGLLQFYEMKEFINIDQKLIIRSMNWLDSRKDENGGFKQNPAKYGFSGIKYVVNNAYIVYVLSEIGQVDIEKQYDTALAEALKSNDLYRMNLLALASFNLKKMPEYKQLMDLIKAKVNKLAFKELNAEQSVINSYGRSMNVEIASLYALALLKEKKVTKEIFNVLDYIQSSKNTYGFGSTQATALALKAITEFSKINMDSMISNDVSMSLNDGAIDLSKKDTNENVILKDLKINTGNNKFSIQVPEEKSVPYLFYVQYQTLLPNNAKECKVSLKTKSLVDKLKISETARVEIEIQNKSNEQLSNPIARIGIPGGLAPEPWQLKELIEKNVVDYYEIFGNELVLYFRKLDANETRKVNIDFKAVIPGKYKGVASSAYLYYENEHKNWNSGLEIEVLP
ncbi:TonB-dependent receptor plug domain-containing protein [Flavobacterium sp. LC2016-01]|uniref:TonB-dependent receptor plug domain-containing protein n=1 Tax=Flavobacterium sp. LC2016-01 TaxID=2675876 RepID=UPI0012BA788B|nr:TonB-dependent receptor plug domain-containing protein [Flavobacterium sp. LC2016-01]MTH14262.1 TonB-dependent receptor plug domain-containing protein [Flavobacterium sp. LC2016-01]